MTDRPSLPAILPRSGYDDGPGLVGEREACSALDGRLVVADARSEGGTSMLGHTAFKEYRYDALGRRVWVRARRSPGAGAATRRGPGTRAMRRCVTSRRCGARSGAGARNSPSVGEHPNSDLIAQLCAPPASILANVPLGGFVRSNSSYPQHVIVASIAIAGVSTAGGGLRERACWRVQLLEVVVSPTEDRGVALDRAGMGISGRDVDERAGLRRRERNSPQHLTAKSLKRAHALRAPTVNWMTTGVLVVTSDASDRCADEVA